METTPSPVAHHGEPRHLRVLDFPRLVEIYQDSRQRLEYFEHPDLTYLFWEATLRCNLRCAHCGSRCEADSPTDELGTEEVKRIFSTIAEDFEARRIFVSITGGEPLLRPDLVEVVTHLSSLGLRSCVVTNGTLLRDREAAALASAGMRTASISVDGVGPTHEAIRGPNTFERALRGITCARRAGFRTVEAITCARPGNLDELGAIEAAVRAAGATRWRLITIDKMGRGGDDGARDLWLDPHGVNRLLDFIALRRARGRAEGDPFDVRFSCGGFLGVARERAVRPGFGQCYAGLCVASLLADGEVSACPSLPRWFAQGSARRERFSTIWRREFRTHRDVAWHRHGPCSDCSWFGACLGGGLHERLAQPREFCWLDRQTESPPRPTQ